jgi:hypothetical protein
MIPPNIPEQIEALLTAAACARDRKTIAALRTAEVLDYIRNRIEVFANKAAANRQEQRP